MIKIIKYETCFWENPTDLDTEVSALLKEGWQPYGNPYVAGDSNSDVVFHCQAMVKYEDTPDHQCLYERFGNQATGYLACMKCGKPKNDIDKTRNSY